MGFLSSLFGNNEKANRQSHIMNLLALACADGELDESEVEVICNVAARIGLSKDEFDEIIDKPENIKFRVPKTTHERVVLLYDMVLVMMADGEIHENEVDGCCLMAERLEFNPDIIRVMVEETIKAIQRDEDLDRVVERLIKMVK